MVGPFHRYGNLGDLQDRATDCVSESRSAFWTCLTKEWWNTPEWREGMIEQLAAEGKNYTEIIANEMV